MSNPLFNFNALPEFSKIKAEHFNPAIDDILKTNLQKIKDIKIAFKAKPNTDCLEQFNEISRHLNNAWSPISHLSSVQDSPEVRDAYKQALPKLTDYSNAFWQDEEIYELYKTIKDSELYSQINSEKKRVVDLAIRDFELSGIALAQDKKETYAKLTSELSVLTQQFSEQVLDATQSFYIHINDERELDGLPAGAKSLLKQLAQQKELDGFVITLDFPSYMPIVTYANNRELREKLYQAFVTRASDQTPKKEDSEKLNNHPVIEQIMQKRIQLAKLLGFANYAEKSVSTKMASNGDQVIEFLEQLAIQAKPQAKKEFQALQAFAKKECGLEDLKPWDVAFVSEKLKMAQYSIDQEQIREFFPIENCLSGLFQTVEKLYNVQIVKNESVDVYHKDVAYFDIFENNEIIAGFYFDLYAREGKRGGAWMDDCRARMVTPTFKQLPVAYMVCNFTQPDENGLATLTHDELTTLFHEFGHGLHHMMTSIDDSNISGISHVAWDAVELPSQFMENFCWQPEVLAYLSSHKDSGEPINDDLLQKMLNAKNFQSAMFLIRQIEFAIYDFKLHQQYNENNPDLIQSLIDDIRKEFAVIEAVPYNRFQNSFTHVFAGGYAAGYYSYLWAEVLSSDAFAIFEKEGIFNKATASRFKNEIISQGGLKDAMELFVNFAGREPKIDALLKDRGLSL
ncbi:M3 family metallopeptidase [Marinicellulosiphila megalodicopiae]|uniref:M3 family metallopeptidase n=1 Tax=Marinicellulosiphila megalodicopiae TaxID=2724896 RepID=UPI003BB07640